MNILLTGGAGYIGSHTAVVLSQAGHEVVLFDNFCNSQKSVLERLQKILGYKLQSVEGDIRNNPLLVKTLQDKKIDAVIHFAGLKAIGESVEKPIEYFSNNVQGTISILDAMQRLQIKTFIFSSSATVYGEPLYLPYDESHITNPINPYGHSKLQVEVLLRSLVNSDPSWKIACLRYFNPVGAHDSGLIGDDPKGVPANLVPYLARVASGALTHVNIFGCDYETRDGTGERDYIHVMDLSEGHMASLDFLKQNTGMHIVNLGTGRSVSVLECINAFERASGRSIQRKYCSRRQGDLPISFANPLLAQKKFGWMAKRTLDEMCRDAWYFQETQQMESIKLR